MSNRPDQPGFVAGGEDRIRDLRYNLFQSVSWLNNQSRQLLTPYGITPKQYSILIILAGRHPESLSIQEVRESLADKMSDASRLIDRLEKKGLLEKFPSDVDRRSNRARLTEQGRKLLVRIVAQAATLEGAVKERLTNEEIDHLNALLTKLK